MLKNIGRTHLLFALGVFVVSLAFALYTQHAWEDWYITFKASKNLATGQGFGYMPNTPLHSFTSVLGTLLPALLSFVTFNSSDDLVLWLFRLINMGVLAATALLLAKSSESWFKSLPATALLLGVFCLDTKTIDFSINGMETPYTVLAIALFAYFVTTQPVDKLGVRLGFVWALLEYTRPDGFVFAVFLGAGMLLFLKDRMRTLRTLAISTGVSLLLFAPWVAFAWWYYGTPVPHSMIAKSALTGYDLSKILERTGEFFSSYGFQSLTTMDRVFAPPYGAWFDMPMLLDCANVLATIATALWLVPGIRPMGRIASFGAFGFLFYLAVFAPTVFPWYLPGASLLALIALAFGLEALIGLIGKRFPKSALATGWTLQGLALTGMLVMTLCSAHQFRLMQTLIERGQRQQIGLWLKENGKPGQTVFLECVGYIGFYSGLKMYDFPGMTSPEMVAARKALRSDTYMDLVKYLRPDWLVVRPAEMDKMWASDSNYIMSHYSLEKVFDKNPEIDKIRFRPFDRYFRFDAAFLVARKVTTP
jgi:hypothetical protein